MWCDWCLDIITQPQVNSTKLGVMFACRRHVDRGELLVQVHRGIGADQPQSGRPARRYPQPNPAAPRRAAESAERRPQISELLHRTPAEEGAVRVTILRQPTSSMTGSANQRMDSPTVNRSLGLGVFRRRHRKIIRKLFFPLTLSTKVQQITSSLKMCPLKRHLSIFGSCKCISDRNKCIILIVDKGWGLYGLTVPKS